jgi:hypothetical protein
MKPKKISLSAIKGALSRTEMKKIMAGSIKCGDACNPVPFACVSGCYCTYRGNQYSCLV